MGKGEKGRKEDDECRGEWGSILPMAQRINNIVVSSQRAFRTGRRGVAYLAPGSHDAPAECYGHALDLHACFPDRQGKKRVWVWGTDRYGSVQGCRGVEEDVHGLGDAYAIGVAEDSQRDKRKGGAASGLR